MAAKRMRSIGRGDTPGSRENKRPSSSTISSNDRRTIAIEGEFSAKRAKVAAIQNPTTEASISTTSPRSKKGAISKAQTRRKSSVPSASVRTTRPVQLEGSRGSDLNKGTSGQSQSRSKAMANNHELSSPNPPVLEILPIDLAADAHKISPTVTQLMKEIRKLKTEKKESLAQNTAKWSRYADALQQHISSLQSHVVDLGGESLALPELPSRPEDAVTPSVHTVIPTIEPQSRCDSPTLIEERVDQKTYQQLQNELSQLEDFTTNVYDGLLEMSHIERYLVKFCKRQNYFIEQVAMSSGIRVPQELVAPKFVQNIDEDQDPSEYDGASPIMNDSAPLSDDGHTEGDIALVDDFSHYAHYGTLDEVEDTMQGINSPVTQGFAHFSNPILGSLQPSCAAAYTPAPFYSPRSIYSNFDSATCHLPYGTVTPDITNLFHQNGCQIQPQSYHGGFDRSHYSCGGPVQAPNTVLNGVEFPFLDDGFETDQMNTSFGYYEQNMTSTSEQKFDKFNTTNEGQEYDSGLGSSFDSSYSFSSTNTQIHTGMLSNNSRQYYGH